MVALSPAAAVAASPPTIKVVSGRADLVSGGDALVRILLPADAREGKVEVRVGRRDVSKRFDRSGAELDGLVKGMRTGRNVITARVRGGEGARLVLTNHPNGGPVFSGPQPQPWKCQAGAVNKKCDQPPRFSYRYQSTNPLNGSLRRYDPKSPPADVAMTTTDGGQRLPFIVRVETGYQDRDEYKIAALFQPGTPWTALRPQPQFNHKLLITHGASCNVDYETGSAPSVTSFSPLGIGGSAGPLADSAVHALGKGYSVMSTALDNSGHNCNVATQAESLVMAKEHLIESYGDLRYTIGTGCSGGSLAQQWIANAYPGIYQGILPTCSFPDTWSSATQVMDYHLLRAYFENPAKWGAGVLWSPTQFGVVEGNLLPVNAIVSDIGFFNAIVPTHQCGGISDQERYHPGSNPGGVRCSIADAAINVFGPREPKVWNASEKKLGRGFAGVPVDNVGVQYGLGALQAGQITPAQFVDLNARIGGLDIDINPQQKRISADQPALENAYRSGSINETNNLGDTAIIDCRGPDPGAAHDSYRAFAIRSRLDRENGTHANQAIWEGPVPIIGDAACADQSFVAMDRWLAAIANDKGGASLAHKVIADKPADIGDRCYLGVGNKLTDGLCSSAIVPVYGTARTVAGDGIATDANKCRLTPLKRGAYAQPFTDGQWTQLQGVFGDGVCDFTRKAVDQGPTLPWLTYQDTKGHVIYGGRRLGSPPRSKGL
ncbi:MAG: hypothetical protein QOG62_2729 [Thermoleophilaceae bacterium]|nr:hypothetical protein [Thermoleophilaceae bacterium]